MHICEHVRMWGERERGVVGLGMRMKFKKKRKAEANRIGKFSAKTAIFFLNKQIIEFSCAGRRMKN
jgi:hypothetical protein